MKGLFIKGGVQIKSNLSIQELGCIISEFFLGGLLLDGLEKNIYEEVPAIFNESLGLSIVLQGYSGLDNEWGFSFNLIPNFDSGEMEKDSVDLSSYLKSLFKERMIKHPEIIII